LFDADPKPDPDPAQNLDADPDPDPGGGGGRSAKNVHPPWQNPRYAPGKKQWQQGKKVINFSYPDSCLLVDPASKMRILFRIQEVKIASNKEEIFMFLRKKGQQMKKKT
jgi:hypothetical protein